MDKGIRVEPDGDVFVDGVVVTVDQQLYHDVWRVMNSRVSVDLDTAGGATADLAFTGKGSFTYQPGTPGPNGPGGDIVFGINGDERLRISYDYFVVGGEKTTDPTRVLDSFRTWVRDTLSGP